MIEFKKGELSRGDTKGIVVSDFDEHSGNDLFLNPLSKESWILTVNKVANEFILANTQDYDFEFIPNEQDKAYDNYDLFWSSDLTVVFSSYDQALKYIRDYNGPYAEQLSQLYTNLLNPINNVEYN